MYWPYNSCVLCTQIQWWGTRGYPPLRGHMVPASSDSLDGVFFWRIFCHNRITPRPSCSSVVQKWNVVSINRSDSTPLVWIIERRSGSDGVLISAVLLIWCSCFSCVVFDLHCTTFPGEGDGRSEADRWGLNEWSTDANTSCQPRSCLINPKMRWACEKWCDQKINPIKSSQHLELGVCVCVQECGLKVHRASTRTYRICLVTCISALQWISISKAGSWSGGEMCAQQSVSCWFALSFIALAKPCVAFHINGRGNHPALMENKQPADHFHKVVYRNNRLISVGCTETGDFRCRGSAICGLYLYCQRFWM